MKKYHFFIPDNGEIIHWSDTLANFREICQHKAEFDSRFAELVEFNPMIRVFRPETGSSNSYYLSELLADDISRAIKLLEEL